MRTNIVERGRPQMAIWRVRRSVCIVCVQNYNRYYRVGPRFDGGNLIANCQSDVQNSLMHYSQCQLPAVGENSDLFVNVCRQIKRDMSFELLPLNGCKME